MSINSGKFYDAVKMREFCDGLKDAVFEFDGQAELAHTDMSSYHSTDTFKGMTAKEAKKFVQDGIGDMLSVVSYAQGVMKKTQTELIEMFETMVDPSQNARIEYDALELINNDYKDLYYTYIEKAANVRRIVDDLNAEFGNYAYFPQPDSQTGADAFIDFCGGDSEGSGYLKQCLNKLVAYDAAASSLINAKDAYSRSDDVDTSIVNTKATLAATPVNNFSFNLMPILPFNSIDYTKLTALIALGAVQAAAYIQRYADKIADWSEEKFFEFIDSLDIPHTWSNQQVLQFFELTEMNISAEDTEANAKHNEQNLTSSILGSGYIENQAYWGDIKYGKSDMAYSGCEIIATYNAIYDLTGKHGTNQMIDMISYYEQNGSSIYGGLGTSPIAVNEYLESQGFNTGMTCETDSESIEAIQNTYDTYIVTAYNDENHLSSEVHTICITEENGKYTIHNDYMYDAQEKKYKEKGPYNSLEDAIDAINDNSQMISLIGVSKPILGDVPESEVYSA